MGFNPPAWASQPCRVATLEVHSKGSKDSLPIDGQPYYLFGRDVSACDVVLDHPSSSRQHAAVVHHTDGRLFLIDLGSSHGTTHNDAPVPPNKPLLLKDGSVVKFGSGDTAYVVRCESAAEKRRSNSSHDAAQGSKRAAVSKVRASHLLVKHSGSRRPSSWKEAQVTRSLDEAMDMIKAFREQLVSGAADFAELASKESHCSSARRGGDLGEFGPQQMQPAFEHVAFALEVGELSQPVVTDSGVHLILRTG